MVRTLRYQFICISVYWVGWYDSMNIYLKSSFTGKLIKNLYRAILILIAPILLLFILFKIITWWSYKKLPPQKHHFISMQCLSTNNLYGHQLVYSRNKKWSLTQKVSALKNPFKAFCFVQRKWQFSVQNLQHSKNRLEMTLETRKEPFRLRFKQYQSDQKKVTKCS